MRISDLSSDVCSSDLLPVKLDLGGVERLQHGANSGGKEWRLQLKSVTDAGGPAIDVCSDCDVVGSSFSWSPDGHQLLFVAHPTGSDWNQAALDRKSTRLNSSH